MKVKLAILEKDASYLRRIVSAFNTKYSDSLVVYSFADPSVAFKALDDEKIDVFLANDVFDINAEALPKRCGFAYLVDSADIENVKGQSAICKFQKIDLIYKQILSIYSEKADVISGLKFDDESTKCVVFSSPCGGVGSSSLAAALALNYASRGMKSLYLCLEKFGSSEAFFSGEGQFGMSDVIFALKSRKQNLALKLESCVRRDPRGVYFFSQAKVALDMMELEAEDIIRLLNELKATGSYDAVIVDTDFSISNDALKILRHAHEIVWVSDGSEIANAKILRAFNAISIKEQNADAPITGRIELVYNKFSSKTGKTLTGLDIKNLGGAPVYIHATSAQIVGQLAVMDFFQNII